MPTTSVDQYAATLGESFGISHSDLLTVLAKPPAGYARVFNLPGAPAMRPSLFVASLALALSALPLQSQAKGCLKGAAVGGVAGHVAGHHAVLGAAAGCVVEHHREKVADRKAADVARQTNVNPPVVTPTAAPR